MRPRQDDILAEAYADAVLIAERETGLPDRTFPARCPWTWGDAMRDGFLGDEP